MSGLSHRIGFFDDAYLASASDMGSYRNAADHAYFDEQSPVPIGGETAALFPPRTDGLSALVEMAKDRISYLNSEYSEDVIEGWVKTGHHAEITRRLGYRLVLQSARVTTTGATIGLVNKGFAAPFHWRPASLVFRRADQRVEIPLLADVTKWKPGPITVREQFTVALTPGTYRVSLWLPDAAPSLRADPRYAIQCANVATWNAATGENFLTELRVTGVS